MPSGKIKKLVHDKGFGFIQTDSGEDVFFHHSTVADSGFDELTEGQRVEYTVEQGQSPKGKGPRGLGGAGLGNRTPSLYRRRPFCHRPQSRSLCAPAQTQRRAGSRWPSGDPIAQLSRHPDRASVLATAMATNSVDIPRGNGRIAIRLPPSGGGLTGVLSGRRLRRHARTWRRNSDRCARMLASLIRLTTCRAEQR